MNKIFVFGSNDQGIHGKGAAKYAVKYYGAIYGQAEGLQGNSYAIPTRHYSLHSYPRVTTLSLERIQYYVDNFRSFAYNYPEFEFEVTPIGCGLAGYEAWQIGPMFKNCSENVHLPKEFKEFV